ncbi:hypothetical protein [Terriglobus roseus]|uniref:LPXTG-motif cell wall anchor domain-containing protein n=1 Tax=Terriglobus roseus TaxID=392734 RepID=A0A1H4KVS7_9BACT|nr:hypothetical protein [Terriglobus roseus]SEB62659.1 hypothetical protein SAMN05443244_1377 [Terriglobus roseus]
MSRLFSVSARKLVVTAAVAFPLLAAAAHAEDTATVVYVSGGQVVVKNMKNELDYGYMLGAGDKVKTAAGDVAVSGLKPGMTITGGLTGGKVVDDASVVKAKVISLSPPNKMVVKVEDESKEVTVAEGVPTGTKVGDTVELTLVSIRTDGDNRPMNAVKAPAISGKLAFYQQPNLEQPDSGTNLPTYGLLGGLLLAVGFTLKAKRRNA